MDYVLAGFVHLMFSVAWLQEEIKASSRWTFLTIDVTDGRE